jgi:hypothetical protein
MGRPLVCMLVKTVHNSVSSLLPPAPLTPSLLHSKTSCHDSKSPCSAGKATPEAAAERASPLSASARPTLPHLCPRCTPLSNPQSRFQIPRVQQGKRPLERLRNLFFFGSERQSLAFANGISARSSRPGHGRSCRAAGTRNAATPGHNMLDPCGRFRYDTIVASVDRDQSVSPQRAGGGTSQQGDGPATTGG